LLSLERTPGSDVIAGTAQAWREAITAGKSYDEDRDAERFKAAFRTLAGRCTHWPAPRDFLDAMPSLPGAPAVAKIDSDDNRRRGMQALADIAARMGWNREDAA